MAKVPFTVNDIEVDGTTLTVDEANNRVGVGTDTPGVTLDVVGVLKASDGVITLTSAGTPSATIADGALAVDTTNDKLFIRSGSAWVEVGGGVTDHGALTGLADDDHTQYLLTNGTRAATAFDVNGDSTFNGNVEVTIDKNNFEYFRVLEGTNNIITANENGLGVKVIPANLDAASLTVLTGSSNIRGLKIIGASSQSANLTEWINSSGTIVAQVNSAGKISSIGLDVTGNIIASGTVKASDGVITLTTAGAPSATIADGALAVDTTNDKLYIRSGSSWVEVAAGGGGSSVVISDTVPSSPSSGDLWYESDTGSFYIYYDSQWIGVGGGGGGASDHGDLEGLGDDDHTQYLLADGSRTLSGNLTVTGTVDGRDVAADGSVLDALELIVTDQKTTSYTLVASDNGKLIDVNSSSNLTITIPQNVLDVGAQLILARRGTGTVTVSPGAGVTLLSRNSDRSIASQYASATLIQTSSNNWYLFGDLV